MFFDDDDALNKDGIIRTFTTQQREPAAFSPPAWSSSTTKPQCRDARVWSGVKPGILAICKADMLIKGQDVSLIKLGTPCPTISSPQKNSITCFLIPFRRGLEKDRNRHQRRAQTQGADGRFGPGLPRVSDGSLLFCCT